MYFTNRPDRPGADQLHGAAVAVAGVGLRADLGSQLVFSGHFRPDADLMDVLAQRLLAEAVFTHFHGHHTGGHVDVIRCANHDCIDLAVHLGQHLAEVYILLGLGEFRGRLGQPPFIHVAQSY